MEDWQVIFQKETRRLSTLPKTLLDFIKQEEEQLRDGCHL